MTVVGASRGRGRIFKLLAGVLEIGKCDLVHEVEIVLEHAARAVVADTVVVEARHGHEALVALRGVVEAEGELIDLHFDDVK